MIKKSLPDLFIAGVIVALAFFFAGGTLPSALPPPAGTGKPAAAADRPQKTLWTPPIRLDAALKQRNLFSETGSYAPPPPPKKVEPALPPNPYTLIAVLLGKEQKAVFRNYTGAIQTLGLGKTLIDGAVLTELSPRSVKVTKGKEVKELTLFAVNLKLPGPPKTVRGLPASDTAMPRPNAAMMKSEAAMPRPEASGKKSEALMPRPGVPGRKAEAARSGPDAPMNEPEAETAGHEP